MENKNQFLKGLISGIAGTAILVIALYSGSQMVDLGRTVFPQESEEFVDDSVVNKINQIKSAIDTNFLEETDEKEMVEGIYRGIVASLGDPYSTYYTEEEMVTLMEQTEGSYSGIGAVLTQKMDTGITTIVQAYEGAPADKAGIQAEDILYKVDGEDISGMDLTNIVALLKGEEGSKVKVTVLRGDDMEEVEVEVTRAEVEIPTVEWDMLDDKIGYIKVTEFDGVTLDQFKEAMEELESGGMEKLIVDLRNNPGGNVSTVCDMLDLIIKDGLLVYTEDKNGERKDYKTSSGSEFDKTIAVLVNGNSASASEIFSGAVQDYDKGFLVGTTTYGKGIVQEIMSLGDGSALKLTYSKYYTPEGRNIHEEGIEPDVEIELDDELKTKSSIEYDEDNQLQKAIKELKERKEEK